MLKEVFQNGGEKKMSANVESLFYAGEVPWHGLGTPCDEAQDSAGALEKSGLDWLVESMPIYLNSGLMVDNYRANVRSSDQSVFGIVTERYKIVQNKEAFAFTDFLLKNDRGIPVKYETAGSLDGGKRVWLLAHLPPEKILGDNIVPYIVFTNSHDGKGSIRISITPTRVVCQNTLNLALKNAVRSWSTRHVGDMEVKMAVAQDTLFRTQQYMEELNEEAEVLQQTKITPSIVQDFLNEVFPLTGASDRQKINIDFQRNLVFDLYTNKPDLTPFKGTAWGLYNAMADFESHAAPLRASPLFKERKFESFIDGNVRLDLTHKFLEKVA
jgi:phage/plasmid-like protein (TIGR03299 family)